MTGIPEEVRLSDGTVAIRDVGRVVFATVLDYSGTPTDVEDDVFISQTIESISGPTLIWRATSSCSVRSWCRP
jgi:hypothetical protein